MMRCHVCQEKALVPSSLYPRFKRVTSDCKPWPSGGQLGTCGNCGCVQTFVDDVWRKEIAAIYKSYTIYYQAAGAEQNVFEQTSGRSVPRSDQLLAQVQQSSDLPRTGRLLDIGCGNGGFLRSFHRHFPEWDLAGLEWDDKYRSEVESIPSVERLFAGGLESVPGQFDAISLVHVLEHIEAPAEFLKKVKEKVRPGAHLIIQLPHYVDNPFELFVADHATHFDVNTIRALLDRAGFLIDRIETTWVPKELSIIARNLPPVSHLDAVATPSLSTVLNWLDLVLKDAQSIARHSSRFGLFGTSIAAAWMFGELSEDISFFVDEDVHRSGGTYFSLPIHQPSTVPEDSDVYVALAPKVSSQVSRRLGSALVRYHEVPELPERQLT
jgi:SAM-dependent methyltransferase